MTAPVSTLTAIAGLVEALEVVPCGGACEFGAHEGRSQFGPWSRCPKTIANAALAAFRARLPMAEDADVVAEVSRAVFGHTGLGVVQLAAVTFSVLRALDAQLEKP